VAAYTRDAVSLILYDNPASTNAHKVRLLLAELDLEAEIRVMPLHAPTAEYRKVHPFGLIPTLVDGDFVITESNVALRYLAEREGRDDLRGAGAVGRARVDLLLDSLSLEVRPSVWELERIVVYGDEADEATIAQAQATVTAALAAYDRLLDETGPYALGSFTIADCAIAGRLHFAERLGLNPGCAPRLLRALRAARTRPAWTAAIGSQAA
jgi:glutathione S-transferase